MTPAKDPNREAKGTSKGGRFAVNPNPKGKTAPTPLVRAGVENKVSPEETYTGNDKVLIDYLKILVERHFWSDIEKLTTTSLWREVQSKYLLSLIYNESDIWDTYYDGLEGIIKNLDLTAEDQKKLLTIDKQGNEDSPIIRGLAANNSINQETIDAIEAIDNDEAWKILYANGDIDYDRDEREFRASLSPSEEQDYQLSSEWSIENVTKNLAQVGTTFMVTESKFLKNLRRNQSFEDFYEIKQINDDGIYIVKAYNSKRRGYRGGIRKKTLAQLMELKYIENDEDSY